MVPERFWEASTGLGEEAYADLLTFLKWKTEGAGC